MLAVLAAGPALAQQPPPGQPGLPRRGAEGPPPGYRAVGSTRQAAPPPAERAGTTGAGMRVMYYHKPADALAPNPTPDDGLVAMAAAAGPVPATGAPPVPVRNPAPLPLPVPRTAVPDRPIPTAPVLTDLPAAYPGSAAPVAAQPAPVAAQPPTSPPADDSKTDPIKPAREVTRLPPREKIFLLYDDLTLEKAILESVARERKIDVAGLRFPAIDPIVPPGTAFVPKTTAYPPGKVVYEPAYVVHGRLYFEEKNSERYGWDLGFVQPFVSAAIFYKDVALWPSKIGSAAVYGCWDTSAGKCLPGAPVPYYLYPPGLTITGTALEAGVITGLAFIP